jgi:putative phosphonate metabolism protein
MTARYAIYYVPSAEDELYRAASAWLGRDAYTDAPLVRPVVAGMESFDPVALTTDPRHYGWHATLKAPFELSSGQSAEALLAETEAYCRNRSAFSATLEVAALGDFLAFTLATPSPEMRLLHDDCVRIFDRFRAPLSDFDLVRRRRSSMSAEQDARLIAFGYPWIFEDFRFHMTLTGRIRDEARRRQVLEALRRCLAAHEGPRSIDGIAVFFQPDRMSDFVVMGRYAFGG